MTLQRRRKKSTRFRGSRSHKRGFKKKARGSGHRGGFGMAGTGKRGDQKKTMVLNLYGNDYFGKDQTLRRGKVLPRPKEINLDTILKNIDSFVKQGKAKDAKGSYEIDLFGYKILANGDVKTKLFIRASSASASAIEKVKRAGGEIFLLKAGKEKAEEEKKAATSIPKAKKKE